jgi:allophanate hydrolase subunit 2
VRLEGGVVSPSKAEIEPEGVAVGSVQVPAGGEPIVLMPDGPVTGGYPKIAVVIRADLPLLGQLRPGEMVRFREVSRAEALSADATRPPAERRA